MFNNTVAPFEKIWDWDVALNVWKSCTSSIVARAFVMAYRIMRKIIEEDGYNAWLCKGTPHCNVRRDFFDTPEDIAP
jgi:hypothetical protein